MICSYYDKFLIIYLRINWDELLKKCIKRKDFLSIDQFYSFYLSLFDLQILKANKVQLCILMFTLNWLEQKSFFACGLTRRGKVWNIISYYTTSFFDIIFSRLESLQKCNKCKWISVLRKYSILWFTVFETWNIDNFHLNYSKIYPQKRMNKFVIKQQYHTIIWRLHFNILISHLKSRTKVLT